MQVTYMVFFKCNQQPKQTSKIKNESNGVEEKYFADIIHVIHPGLLRHFVLHAEHCLTKPQKISAF